MSAREWKPGDVAMHDEYGIALVVTYNRLGCNPSHEMYRLHAHLADGDWLTLNDLRPLVVIDPEDREAVGRLLDAYGDQVRAPYRGEDEPDDWRTDRLQAALREFANPTPPKPDEPQGRYAVVVDDEGNEWLRGPSGMWSEQHTGKRRGEPHHFRFYPYADIAAVRVLSEGVQP